MTESTNESTNPQDIVGPPTPEELLAERERAVSLLSFLPELKSYTIYCARTGVPIANMQLIQQAGKMPYLSQWRDSVAYHPLFSLPQQQLLAWTRKNWNQLFRAHTLDRISDVQRQQFQIAFMAILHSMDCLDQQVPALPSFATVRDNLQRLLELAYWYNYLDSKRFKFPTLRINKLNSNGTLHDIAAYFEVCDSVRHDWETSKDAKYEDAKLEAARRAEKAVRGSHVRAISKKALWNWFLSSLASSNSKKYSLPEWMEWKEDSAKLWFGSENQQLQYVADDVNSIEDVFLTECTLGTAVSHAFQMELSKIRDHITSHAKIFEIDWDVLGEGSGPKRTDASGTEISSNVSGTTAPQAPGAEPQLNEFNSRSEYIRAKAKWDISCRQYEAWLAKQPPKQEGNSDETGNADSE